MNFKGIISTATERTTKTGNAYTAITVLSPGERRPNKVTVFIWGITPDKIKLYKGVKGVADEKDGNYSCSFSALEFFEPTATLANLLPHAVDKSTWLVLADNLCELLKDSKQISFVKTMFERLYEPYSISTAAKSNHHNFAGGLLQHTYELLNMFYHMEPALFVPMDKFVIIVSCLFHDYYKLSEYNKDFSYNRNMFLVGHPVGSAEAAVQCLKAFTFEDEDLLIHIRHCILAHHMFREWGSPVTPSTPEAMLVANLDMISGKCTQIYYAEDGERVDGTQVYHL